MNNDFAVLLEKIAALPAEWHTAGTFSSRVLRRIVELTAGKEIKASAETGAGKSTLLLSHLSRNHLVFALDYGDSLTAVLKSPLFRSTAVTVVEGATQATLRTHDFTAKFDLVLIDGPHGYPFPDMEYWCFYPHIAAGGLLILDDIHIPTIHNLFKFLKEEQMFDYRGVVGTTAFFVRNETPLFDPFADGWWLQNYNKARYPATIAEKLKRLVPAGMQKILVRLLKRN
jgi:hypothetical protein